LCVLLLRLPYAADVLQHFESVHGIRMQSLSPFNEPASPAWCLQLNNRQEGCYFSKPRSHKVTAGARHTVCTHGPASRAKRSC
jgi:hypothetical protein